MGQLVAAIIAKVLCGSMGCVAIVMGQLVAAIILCCVAAWGCVWRLRLF